jgi:hypothetical protein
MLLRVKRLEHFSADTARIRCHRPMHIQRLLQQGIGLTTVSGLIGMFRAVIALIEMAEVACQRSRGASYIDNIA